MTPGESLKRATGTGAVRRGCFRFGSALERAGLSGLVLSVAFAAESGAITTTIYVGPYFELRDYDAPVKYVFNGGIRVARITGSLSGNARVQRLRLYPGWNLCSVAVTGSFPASGTTDISAAYEWNPDTGTYLPAGLEQTFVAGAVLWLKARTNSVVNLMGSYVDPVNASVNAGGTYVAGAGLEEWSPVLPQSVSTWIFQSATGSWLGRLPSVLGFVSEPALTLAPGDALFVSTPALLTLEVPDPGLRVRYYHPDHLGSSGVISDGSGAVVEETAFWPFGIARNNYRPRQIEEPYQFTQKERDRETGLDCFGARYLVGLARFVSADQRYVNAEAFGKNAVNPQQLDAYSYAVNSPLRFIDPDGRDISTPLVGYKSQMQKNRDAIVTLSSGTRVSVKQDSVVTDPKFSAFDDKFAEAATYAELHANWDAKKGAVSVSVTLQTFYQEQVRWADREDGFGLGLGVPAGPRVVGIDILGLHRRPTVTRLASDDPAIKSRESQRGAELLSYMEKNPIPVFTPRRKGDIQEFYEYQNQLEAYEERMYAAVREKLSSKEGTRK